ncbi:hypothetical protein WJX73_002139 [Symbiochloris irregularis]|uniref:Trafficking protein particle complex subunit 2-like protein n=1 Tax=Symbiochloris irregularis TaxID=706552 RepID=A0AAW1NYY3_9CHLO
MTITCAAVVGRANNPLYLEACKPASDEEVLKYHYVVHCALDTVEEKVALRTQPGEIADSYLGMLYPTEDHKVYGYVSNTSIKFIFVVEEPAPKDEDMRALFKRFHAAFIDVVSNPFYEIGQPITSTSFDASVRTIVTTV